MRGFVVGLAVLAGCSGTTDTLDTTRTVRTDTGTQGPGPVTDTGPSTPVATGDTAPTGDTGFEPFDRIGRLQFRAHDEVGSMIYASWEQTAPETVHVEYFLDNAWHAVPSVKGIKGDNEALVLGIPFGTEPDVGGGYLDRTVEWRVVAESDGFTVDASKPFVVEGMDSDLPLATVTVSDPKAWLPGGNYLLTSINQDAGGWTSGTYWTLILDRQGRPVWALDTPARNWTLYPQISQDRTHIVYDEQTKWSLFDGGEASQVHRTYLDEEIEVVGTRGLHHAFLELPDGTLAWGSKDHGGGEALVELAPGQKKETILWTCADDWPNVSSCESNSMWYDATLDRYLYSFYTNNSLVEVDRATGTSVWWAGTVQDGYTFQDPSTQFDWQHGISWTDTGTLLVSSRAWVDPDGDGTNQRSTLLREYNVNRPLETLVQVFSYDPGIYAATNGDALRLANGNTLHVLGSAGHIYEIDDDRQNPTEVWHIDFGGSHLLGRGEFIEDLYTLVKPK